MGVIWKARPDVTYFGEGKSYYAFRDYYEVHTSIAVYQMTTISQRPEEWHNTDHRLWMVRNIYDVVSSMINLGWIRQGLAGNEIQECIARLPRRAKEWADHIVAKFEWNGKDSHLIGALTYCLKHSFISQHRNVCRVNYESLVQHPEKELKRICEEIGVEFRDEMLNHHKHLDGELHGTRFDRKIDSGSIGKANLTDQQKGEIQSLVVAATSALGIFPANL
jgi:hypothetical protein